MFIDTENLTEHFSFSDIQSAGKVNFNVNFSSDYFISESFKTLRTNILFCGSDIKTIVLTSCRPSEGKSTITTELAKCLAESEKRVLLIDADMRKSMLQPKSTRTNRFYGLSEFLSNQVTLSQVLYNTQNPYFDVIFSGHFPPNPAELLMNKKFQRLLDDAKQVYDYVIVDSPPLGAVIDAAVIASCCDGAVMVLSTGKIGKSEALGVKNQLLKSNCRILGVILNDLYAKRTKYYKKYNKKYEYAAPKNGAVK